jgi:hypothetical protein
LTMFTRSCGDISRNRISTLITGPSRSNPLTRPTPYQDRPTRRAEIPGWPPFGHRPNG